jgi:hypothetical protein
MTELNYIAQSAVLQNPIIGLGGATPYNIHAYAKTHNSILYIYTSGPNNRQLSINTFCQNNIVLSIPYLNKNYLHQGGSAAAAPPPGDPYRPPPSELSVQ